MKIRSKLDRQERPLLTQEAPILSDEFPPSWEDGDRSTGAKSKQLGANGKKGPWRKIFGKGVGARRKQEENSVLASIEGGMDTSRSELLSTERMFSSTVENINPFQQQQILSINTGKDENENDARRAKPTSLEAFRVRGKRDDVSESSATKNNEASTPQSTKSSKSNKGKTRSFMRSLKMKSPQDLPSPSQELSSPSSKTPVTPQQLRELDQINAMISPPISSKSSSRHSRGSSFSARKKRSPTTSTPRSSTSASGVTQNAKYDVKKILSKPFGREHIFTTKQTWVVHVSRAEWDADESLWKYRINIKQREGNKLQDFASCFTLRSLEDFHWLEQSLQTEFFGGLLLPSLSIYLGLPDILSCQHEVDSQLLSNWMNDTLNGIRGQGEIMFPLTNVNIATCESMEAFLYRSDLVQPEETAPSSPQKEMDGSPQKTSSNSFFGDENSKWNFFPELCYADCVAIAKPIREVSQSQSLGTANTFNLQADSFVEAATFDDLNSSLTVHSTLLKAERDLILCWRSRALQTMERLRILKEQEKFIGVAWKRFAIGVSNLFAYEKDIETARLGDSKSRRDLQIPYRRLQKSVVDDCLRILTRQKTERATPGIDAINVMLSAYVADLSTVQPSVEAYLKGVQKLAIQKSKIESPENEDRNETSAMEPSGTLADKIQEGLNVVKKQLTSNMQDDLNQIGSPTSEDYQYLQRQEVQKTENRLLRNEVLLKGYLTTMCKTAPVRTSRIIYAYLEKEIDQCKSLNAAAMDLKAKINVATKETLSKMIHRHHGETKEDKDTEIKLVHKIVNIGHTKRFVKEGDENSEEVEKGVELSFETAEQESVKMKRRDKAMNDCRARIGRWDAKLAMSIMEAVGVTDANVRVEETTRDLRMVRKYAIGLREHVERCTECLEELRTAILEGALGDIRDVRGDFATEIQNLLSFTYMPADDKAKDFPKHLVEKEGISLADPAGWRSKSRGSCGSALSSYIETRDSGTEWLIDSLSELLKEYSHRVEAIESFVYMECVGIQLEKHFSHARASALTAFEKKTDITSAINIATRKKMPVLVKELKEKLNNLGPVVSHTTVKEAKEAHLESKALKQELHALAMRRLARARETSTERAIALMTVWSKEEEGCTITEQGILEDLTYLVQESVKKDQLEIYVGASPGRT